MRIEESADCSDCWNDRYIGAKLLMWWAGTFLENQALDKDIHFKIDGDDHCRPNQAISRPVTLKVNIPACSHFVYYIGSLLLQAVEHDRVSPELVSDV